MTGDPQDLWSRCIPLLREHISETVWLGTFRDARPVTYDGRTLTLAVPNDALRDRIEGMYRLIVEGALRELTSDGVGVNVVTIHFGEHAGLAGEQPVMPSTPTGAGGLDRSAVATGPRTGEVGLGPSGNELGLNEKYSFDAFVIGQSNRFAHAAALAVAERPGQTYNPLFIYGKAGLGKTHLLQAIGHYVRHTYPDRRVLYVSTETFMNDFVSAIRAGANSEFKRRYREVDVLLVDDVQFLEGKESTQEELFHTFNELHQVNRQMVFTSDRTPDNIRTLEERLRSRFKMGLITDVQPPDLETRMAILVRKTETSSAEIPVEVLYFVAENVAENIRELEGAINRLQAWGSLNRQLVTVEVAREVLAHTLSANAAPLITPERIIDAICSRYSFSREELVGRSRRRPLVTARQVAMYVMRELTDLSFPAIGREFGDRDHTTVMHAVEKVGSLMKERRAIFDQVNEMIATLRSGKS
jgi:chromosomal replication initiator protein